MKMLIIVSMILLSGCSSSVAVPGHFVKAEELCKANGGVDFLRIYNISGKFIVFCNNSATFKLQVLDRSEK